MYHKMVLTKVFFPITSTTLLSASVLAATPTEGNKEEEEKKNMIKARDLAIYSKPEEEPKQQEKESKSESESPLFSIVKQVREGVWQVTGQLNQVTEQIDHVIETGKAHTSSAIQMLREEDNYMQRYGAIAAGGLIGYIVALRRGWFRRLVYTGTGATAVAALCYPDQASEYSEEGFRQTKRYVVIAYHFVNGVLRDYVGVQLPSLPSPLSIGGPDQPTSSALMPPPASSPSHIQTSGVPSSGPIPMPPIDLPSVTDPQQKKQG